MAGTRKIVISKVRRTIAASPVRAPIWKVQGTSRMSNQLRFKIEERAKAKAQRFKEAAARVPLRVVPIPAAPAHLYTNSSTNTHSMPLMKMYKLVDDPCFGQKHELIEQCKICWIKKSCATKFRNRHHA